MTREDYKNDKIYSDTGYCSARFARVRPQANERKNASAPAFFIAVQILLFFYG